MNPYTDLPMSDGGGVGNFRYDLSADGGAYKLIGYGTRRRRRDRAQRRHGHVGLRRRLGRRRGARSGALRSSATAASTTPMAPTAMPM